ncbi:MAG TPA: glycosyltransferase family A protein [Devosia sp.]|nr:glycosyltransferase family A protein [Devosia sp.]
MIAAPRLTIAIATTAERSASIRLGRLPVDLRWRYVIYCQGGTPAVAPRADISVVVLQGRGVAASRNAAIGACDTELLLFSDDDVGLEATGLTRLIDVFTEHTALGLFAGRTVLQDGHSERVYPDRPQRLTLFNSARVGTVELAVRPAYIRDNRIGFDLNFGAGGANAIGDEYIFVADCIRSGLWGGYWPITIAVHDGSSSGTDFASPQTTRARAKVFERVFGRLVSVPIKLGFIWRHRRRFGSFTELLTFARVFLLPLS